MHVSLHERPFVSISGEAGFFPQGSICVFLRFQGCNLRCKYPCDTVRSQKMEGGKQYTIKALVTECSIKQVLITGGEPILQREGLTQLIQALLSAGHTVQVETNGTQEIPHIPEMKGRGGWVVDRKGPSAGIVTPTPKQMEADKLYQWEKNDVVFKYVVASSASSFYYTDRKFLFDDMRALGDMGYKGNFIISPVDAATKGFGNLVCFPPEFKERVIISLQIHKLLGLA